MKNILLVIDLQPEFATSDKEKYKKTIEFANNNRHKYDKVVATMFSGKNPNFQRYLDFDFPKDAKRLEFDADQIIKKTGCLFDIQNLLPKDDTHYDLIGCETDACIIATAYYMLDSGYSFSVLSDYIFTKSELSDCSLKILKKNIEKALT